MICSPRLRKAVATVDERDVAGLYIAEMHALLPVAQRHLNTLGGPARDDQRTLAAGELARLATAMADLSAGFRAVDCAQVAHTLSRAVADPDATTTLPPALLAAATDALTYLNGRVRQMGRQRQVLAASDTERAAAARLRAQLLASDAPPVTYPPPTAAAFSLHTPLAKQAGP